jgi:cytosine/adenosine deaminase-related metal-dependent hydrolase
MGTVDGARSLRAEDEFGSLEVGKRADVIVLDGAALAPGGDEATRILYGGGSRAVRDVIVDGQLFVRDRVPTRMDPAEVRARAAEALPGLLSRAGLR